MNIKAADAIEKDELVITPQHGCGVLIAFTVTETELIDDGKFIEITTDDRRKHLVKRGDRIVVVS